MNSKQAQRVAAYVPPRVDDLTKLAVKLNKTLGTDGVAIDRDASGTGWVLTQHGRRLSMPYTKAEMTICVAAYIAGYETSIAALTNST